MVGTVAPVLSLGGPVLLQLHGAFSSREQRMCNMLMQDCPQYRTCNANLCPHDPDIDKRSWFLGEDVCRVREHKAMPMIRRQRQLNRLRPAKYMETPLSPSWLSATARVKRVLTDEQRTRLVKQAEIARASITPRTMDRSY